jgi:acetylglutamate kinase
MDIQGICVCKKHQREGIGLYMILIHGGEKEYNAMLKSLRVNPAK